MQGLANSWRGRSVQAPTHAHGPWQAVPHHDTQLVAVVHHLHHLLEHLRLQHRNSIHVSLLHVLTRPWDEALAVMMQQPPPLRIRGCGLALAQP